MPHQFKGAIKLEPLATPPAQSEGVVYYDDTSGKLRIGDGVAFEDVAVPPDGVTLEESAGTLRIRDGGVTKAKIAAAVTYGAQRFDSSGTFIVPRGVTTVYITGVAGGGGGGAKVTSGQGGGGGSGAFAYRVPVTVTQNELCAVTVPAASGAGLSAGNVVFQATSLTVTLGGGQAGNASNVSSGAGGPGGVHTNGTGNGTAGTAGPSGGNGAPSVYAAGTGTNSGIGVGATGNFPGAGSMGSAGPLANYAGSPGTAGFLLVEW